MVRRWNTLWLYAEDAWRLHDRVTLTYGLGWGFDGVLNHDLSKPALLAPLLGSDGLGPTRPAWDNFSPAAGVIWTPSSDRKTVLRAAAGRFFRPHGLTSAMDAERVALGPPGLGRQTRAGERHSQPIARNPRCLRRHAAGLSRPYIVHRRRCHGGPSGDQGHSRPEPGRCRSDRAADSDHQAGESRDLSHPRVEPVGGAPERRYSTRACSRHGPERGHRVPAIPRRAAERRSDRREPLQQRSRSGDPPVRRDRGDRPRCLVLTRSDQRLRRAVSFDLQGAAASRREAVLAVAGRCAARMRFRGTPAPMPATDSTSTTGCRTPARCRATSHMS